MKVLAIRTDKPQAELYVLEGNKKIAELKWQAHLKLTESLNSKIEEILNKSSTSYNALQAIVVYKGPGSFTGLRIGISTANALAYGLDLPIVATSGEGWLKAAIEDLLSGQNHKTAVPEYGAPARITKPRK